MAPQIEMLKHHGQPGAQQAQLVLVGHLQLAVFIPYQANILAAHDDRAFARFFKEVNTAQKGTFSGTR